MGLVVAVLVVVSVVVWLVARTSGSLGSPARSPTCSSGSTASRSSSTGSATRSRSGNAARPVSRADTGRQLAAEMQAQMRVEEARLRAQVDAEAARLMPEVEAETARMMAKFDKKYPAPAPTGAEESPETDDELGAPPPATGPNGGPSWMPEVDWSKRVVTYERQGRTSAEIAATAAYLEQRGPKVKRTRAEAVARSVETGVVTRDVYVPKEDEARYLTRDAAGLPELRLVDSGDRLSIWSAVDGGALINPKGPGLRKLGLHTSYAHGSQYYAATFKAADLSKGQRVDLVRQPDNPHDANAIAMCAPGSTVRFAHVQKGRAPAIARRMDAGEDMAAVSLRGPGRGQDDGTAFVIIGARADLEAMLAL